MYDVDLFDPTKSSVKAHEADMTHGAVLSLSAFFRLELQGTEQLYYFSQFSSSPILRLKPFDHLGAAFTQGFLKLPSTKTMATMSTEDRKVQDAGGGFVEGKWFLVLIALKPC